MFDKLVKAVLDKFGLKYSLAVTLVLCGVVYADEAIDAIHDHSGKARELDQIIFDLRTADILVDTYTDAIGSLEIDLDRIKAQYKDDPQGMMIERDRWLLKKETLQQKCDDARDMQQEIEQRAKPILS